MTLNPIKTDSIDWQEKADQYLVKGNYTEAASIYEQAIALQPNVKSHYWHMGLLVLLQGKEEEAHTTWLVGMMDGDSEQIEQWTEELRKILEKEAFRQQQELEEDLVAWLIRQHIREICPQDIHNLLHLIPLAIKLNRLREDELIAWEVIELLESQPFEKIDSDLLLQVLRQLIGFVPLHPYPRQFAEACVHHLSDNPEFRDLLMGVAMQIAYELHQPSIAISWAELSLRAGTSKQPQELLGNLAGIYDYARNFALALETAKRSYDLCENLPDKVFANHRILKSLLGAGGYWEKANAALAQQDSLLLSLIEKESPELDLVRSKRLLSSTFLFPYLRDDPLGNRNIQNQVADLFQSYIQKSARETITKFQEQAAQRRQINNRTDRPLKIGYISHCLRSHSVGWLARWVFQYHNHERFEIHGYFMNYHPLDDALQAWYLTHVDQVHKLGADSLKNAEQIAKDEIDILIDIDSLTLDRTFTVMAYKPAPIQITWLGWDAAGLPAIDYFIADPYVLPITAQNYYTEKIWCLPQTYISVDGFEVGIPTLRREDLGIPTDAVIYYSGQKGYKRHLPTARLQMKILKAVPNSYFLIKSRADETAVKNFFTELAEAEGIDSSRLRFIPSDPSEEIHRANLGIVDVVLDTYPYNGATTTLETLWMGVPMVTRVGQQFSARNSYTMMVNAGITEGIAGSDEEYIEWGIRLGTNPQLRQEISWKLLQGRQTEPLWNAKQFTGEMENAYEQMWQRYLYGWEHLNLAKKEKSPESRTLID